MWDYLRRHEAFVEAALGAPHDAAYWQGLRDFHSRQLAFLQHERLVHLLVFLAVCLLCVLGIGYVGVAPSWWGFSAVALLLVLVVAYLVHYFRLENGVQRWYHLANRLDEQCGLVCARYDGGAGSARVPHPAGWRPRP